MTIPFFFSRSYLNRLSREDRERIARGEEAAAKRMKARGDEGPSEVQVIRRRRRETTTREHATP